MKADVSYFDSHSIGQLFQILNSEVELINRAFGHLKIFQLRAFGQAVSGFMTVVICDYRVSSLLGFALIFVVIFAIVFAHLSFIHFEPMRRWKAHMQTIASETISNHNLITAYNGQKLKQIDMRELMENTYITNEADFLHAYFIRNCYFYWQYYFSSLIIFCNLFFP
jgi:ABC-type multidrug transport system fused ATPase/permease subunit